jgi:hypothetical protein
MPGWTGCDVCTVIDALQIAFDESSLPDPGGFADPRFQQIEARLSAAAQESLAARALVVADGLRELGQPDLAQRISERIPVLVQATDVESASLLAQAQLLRARTLEAQGRVAEASSSFALAGHLYTLAGRAQRP